jgi:hypothetical protein
MQTTDLVEIGHCHLKENVIEHVIVHENLSLCRKGEVINLDNATR